MQNEQHSSPMLRRSGPENREALIRLVDSLSSSRFSSVTENVYRHLENLFQLPDVGAERLARVSVSALKCNGTIKQLVDVSQSSGTHGLEQIVHTSEFRRTLEIDLLHSLLRKTVVLDLEFEKLFTELRSFYLEQSMKAAPEFDADVHVRFMVSLACQCFNNEYVYPLESWEDGLLDEVAQHIAKLTSEDSSDVSNAYLAQSLCVYGMYRPLWSLASAEQLSQRDWEDLAPLLCELLDVQVRAHFAELAIMREIPTLGMSDNQVSQAVRKQYEEHPYPRWMSITKREPKVFAEAVRSRFPLTEKMPSMEKGPEILVAGCGTGHRAISVANEYVDAKVMAVDISQASLAYGMRKAREYGISNISFCHADILNLTKLDRRFHLIEAVGVLHHMEDPATGWGILADLLLQGGLLKVGVYSRLAREYLNPARDLRRRQNFGAQPEELRALRQEIIAMAGGDGINRVLETPDFFTLGEFRDLACHTHEIEFTLAEVTDILNQLNLEFVGFEGLKQSTKKQFRQLYPFPPQYRDLLLWDRFERDHPDTFESMYVLWVSKK